MPKTRPNQRIGSVIAGTTDPDQIIPALLDELKRCKPLTLNQREFIKRVEREYIGVDAGSRLNRIPPDRAIDRLVENLDSHALPYFYFGIRPTDREDYGWWLYSNWDEDFDGLRVTDTSKIPKGYRGEVISVNDHGNTTLYVKGRTLRVIWEVV